MPHGGAPKAQGLTARARTKRSLMFLRCASSSDTAQKIKYQILQLCGAATVESALASCASRRRSRVEWLQPQSIAVRKVSQCHRQSASRAARMGNETMHVRFGPLTWCTRQHSLLCECDLLSLPASYAPASRG